MTTKPKTRKAPAAKRAAPKKAALVKADGEPKLVISGICKLIARCHWLEASRTYIDAITEPEADRLIMSHQNEQRNIEVRLSKLVPKNLWEVMSLLEFATEIVEQGACPGNLEVKMLKNAQEGVRLVWSRTESEAGRAKVLAARAA